MPANAGVVARLLTAGQRAHEIAAVTALMRSGALPVEKLASIIDHLGSAVELLAMLDEQRLPPSLAGQLGLGGVALLPTSNGLSRTPRKWLAAGLDIRTVLDPALPSPPALHLQPAAHALRRRHLGPAAGLLRRGGGRGTRRATDAGLRRARVVVKELAAAGTTILSGLALGIDTAAHESRARPRRQDRRRPRQRPAAGLPSRQPRRWRSGSSPRAARSSPSSSPISRRPAGPSRSATW